MTDILVIGSVNLDLSAAVARLPSPGETVTKEQLSQRVLGRRHLPYDRSIDTHISNVRGKLARAGVSSPSPRALIASSRTGSPPR